MSYILTFTVFIAFLQLSIAQNLMFVNEIFDFNIGDKYQYIYSNTNYQLPNADRYTITDKYYSEAHDTVFYVRLNDSYYTVLVNENPPYLEYHFQTNIDTVFYTELDSLITNSDYWHAYQPDMYEYDTLIYTSDEQCDSLINGYTYSTNFFEGEYFEKLYGKGIGLIYDSYDYPSEFYAWDYSLFYFEKGGIGCGNPDLTTDADDIDHSDEISVYPNPSDDYFYIDCRSLQNLEIRLYSIDGKLIDKKIMIKGQRSFYDCSLLESGLYMIYIQTQSGLYSKLVVKNH